ncbi:MAG: methylmalonyl-CoA mutase [Deltaproteobacteria bacterium]|nr:methylmalonyl-CoA mutase [Deltaproteobacteria bacterium]MBW2118236.1 methylmalonyl-CoA mutase [Deltaproteobacteria bacterium]MBW2342956.1 methylmalonyl-CoA mutase [Deltaproteobacteria bacterium]
MSELFKKEAIEEINRKNEAWEEEVYGPGNEPEKVFETLSGVPVEPLYTPAHTAHMDYLNDLGFPGREPYVRGVHPTMYRGRTWTIRQLAGFGPPEETNKRYKFLLKEGATGINGVFDYPTLRGFDSTDPYARADAGRGGVAIDTLEDMSILFDGIPIDKVSSSLVTCQPICNISVQSMYFANAGIRGIPLNMLTGTSQNDFLMETAITVAPELLPPKFSFKLSCDAIEFCTKHVPRWNPISFAGYNYREAGCTADQEIAFVIANAIACSEELIRRGLDIDDFAPRLSFFLSSHNDFFEEIAKYRAARRVWFRIMKERFKAKNPRSLTFRFHVQTAGVALTAQQPLNNISRAAYHALAAVLGGAQSVHVDGYDEALCTPTELSSLTALRTNQVLQLETRVTNTIDPLGGSYFVEALTNKLEEQTSALLEKIDRIGGIVKATETGWIHKEISNSAYEYQLAIESVKMPIVGVNCYRMEDEELPIQLFEVPETLQIQEQKLKKIKNERNGGKVQEALDAVARCCDEDGNLMEVLVEGVKARITEGEISNTLKGVYGTWNPPLF